MATAAKQKLALTFALETPPHITKNAVRYQETGDPDNAKVGTLYMKKSTLGSEPFPKEVSVSFSW